MEEPPPPTRSKPDENEGVHRHRAAQSHAKPNENVRIAPSYPPPKPPRKSNSANENVGIDASGPTHAVPPRGQEHGDENMGIAPSYFPHPGRAGVAGPPNRLAPRSIAKVAVLLIEIAVFQQILCSPPFGSPLPTPPGAGTWGLLPNPHALMGFGAQIA